MSTKLFREGKQLCLEGDIKRGLSFLEQAILCKPNDVTFLAHYAFWLQEGKKYPEAIEIALKALKKKSSNVMSHCVTFDSSLRLGDIEGCEIALNRMERSRHKVTKRLCKIPEKRRSLEEYLAVREYAPQLQQLPDTVRTIQECEKGLRLAPLDQDLLYLKLWALFEQQRFADVITAYSSVHPLIQRELSSKAGEILGKCFYTLNLIPEAIQVLENVSAGNEAATGVLQNLKALQENLVFIDSDEAKLGDKIEALEKNLKICKDLPENITLKRNLLISGITITLSFEFFTSAIRYVKQLLALPLPPAESESWTEKLVDLREWTKVRAYKNSPINSQRALGIFKLSPKASLKDVQDQRKVLLKRYHPDKNQSDPNEQIFQQCYKSLTQELNECFKYLKTYHDFQGEKKQVRSWKKKSTKNETLKQTIDRLAAEAPKLREQELQRQEKLRQKELRRQQMK